MLGWIWPILLYINENIPTYFLVLQLPPKARHRRAPESHNKIVPFAPRNNTSHKHSKPKSDTQQTTSSCQATTHCAAEEQYLIRSILTNLRGFGAGASDGTMLLLFAFQCDGHYIRIAHVEWRREHQLVRAHSFANVHIIAEYCRYSSRDNILHPLPPLTHIHTPTMAWHFDVGTIEAANHQHQPHNSATQLHGVCSDGVVRSLSCTGCIRIFIEIVFAYNENALWCRCARRNCQRKYRQ